MTRRARREGRSTSGFAAIPLRELALATFACLACAHVAHAASDAAGTAAASFLSVGSGASVLSMGGATLASGRDLASAAWNPASLARVDATQFSLTHAPMPGGATQEWLAAGGRVQGAWRWSAQTLFHREAGIEGRDASNNPTGDLSASDVGVGATLARRIGGVLDVGLGAEWVHESLADASGSGVAFSGGVRSEAGPFGFAVAARHLGGGMNYGATRYDLPGVIAAGMSYEDTDRGLRVAADLESPTHYYRSLRVGGEWLWRGQFALRAGYRSEIGNTDAARLSGPTFGMGTGAGSVWMDYAFMPGGGEGAGEHRLGITFCPGGLAHGKSDGGMRMTGTAPAAPRPRSTTSATAPPRTAAPAAREPRAPVAAAVPSAASSAKPDSETTPVPQVVKSPSAEFLAGATVPVTTKPAPVPKASAPAAEAAAPVVTKAGSAASGASPGAAAATPAPKPVAEPAGKPAPAAAPAARPARPSTVVVAEGETLASIARRWGTSVAAIMMANNLVNEKVAPGKKLKLPPAIKPGPRVPITIGG